jgi:lysophospholipid acyltransferase (LPLAT)-like uncharacterized protein
MTPAFFDRHIRNHAASRSRQVRFDRETGLGGTTNGERQLHVPFTSDEEPSHQTSACVPQHVRPIRRLYNRWLRSATRRTVTLVGPWFIAIGMLILRWTCRVNLRDDPRPRLRSEGAHYVYSVLHAHQISAATCRERGTAAMVSQSKDGDFVATGLRMAGIKTIRGSSRNGDQDKGGLSALHELAEHVRTGAPAYLAVDGPRGPRNRVHKGVAVLSLRTGAAVLNVVAVPTRRWIFQRSWDRFQIPKPFCRIDIFAELIWPQDGESVDDYRRLIEESLSRMESLHDPIESRYAARRTRGSSRGNDSGTAAA